MQRSRRAFVTGSAGLLTASAGCTGAPSLATGESDTERARTGEERPPRGTYRLGFVGDLMLGRNVDAARNDDPPATVWGSTHDLLDSLDTTIGNLECCLSTRGTPTPGRTYHFRADPAWAVPALRAGGIEAVSLANNHVLDYGREAFRDTLRALDGGGVVHAGAGPNERAAHRPALLEVSAGEGDDSRDDGDRRPLRVALVALTDQSPSYAAGPNRPGTAYTTLSPTDPLSRLRLRSAVTRARRLDPDLVVVSLHWGPNWVPVPAGRYRRVAHLLVDAGADVVHGHSAHVVQGVERYGDGLVIHDAGDFVDDYVVKPDLRNDLSALFELRVADGVPASLRVRPARIENRQVNRATGEDATRLRTAVRDRSTPFGTTGWERDGESLVLPLGPT